MYSISRTSLLWPSEAWSIGYHVHHHRERKWLQQFGKLDNIHARIELCYVPLYRVCEPLSYMPLNRQQGGSDAPFYREMFAGGKREHCAQYVRYHPLKSVFPRPKAIGGAPGVAAARAQIYRLHWLKVVAIGYELGCNLLHSIRWKLRE